MLATSPRGVPVFRSYVTAPIPTRHVRGGIRPPDRLAWEFASLLSP
jgi:hypothetical protein